jgi:hypothetical protein
MDFIEGSFAAQPSQIEEAYDSIQRGLSKSILGHGKK